jgi:thiamine transport system substrate-binding protein
MTTTRAFAPFALALILAASAAGCFTPSFRDDVAGDESYQELGFTGSDATGRDAGAWPDLRGATLTILDHGAFAAFDHAAEAFTALTGATVVHVEADDTGSALNRAILERGDPSADVIYGVDNVLLARAEDTGVLEAYTPVLAPRVQPQFVFFGSQDPWPATPVDHGYIAVNWDPAHEDLQGKTIASLDDVRANADLFVTQDPNTSSVGLGFLLATVATYGNGWQDYWADLFDGGVLVTAGWGEAYEQHFSAGYGVAYGGAGDKPIVTSYSESPAVERYFDPAKDDLANALVAPGSTFHQVQTMAILKGTHHRAAAQAWIEFTLTDAFQELAAPDNGVYPVVASVDANVTYGSIDPEPGTFVPAMLSYQQVGTDLEGWLRDWTDLCERHDCR